MLYRYSLTYVYWYQVYVQTQTHTHTYMCTCTQPHMHVHIYSHNMLTPLLLRSFRCTYFGSFMITCATLTYMHICIASRCQCNHRPWCYTSYNLTSTNGQAIDNAKKNDGLFVICHIHQPNILSPSFLLYGNYSLLKCIYLIIENNSKLSVYIHIHISMVVIL